MLAVGCLSWGELDRCSFGGGLFCVLFNIFFIIQGHNRIELPLDENRVLACFESYWFIFITYITSRKIS